MDLKVRKDGLTRTQYVRQAVERELARTRKRLEYFQIQCRELEELISKMQTFLERSTEVPSNGHRKWRRNWQPILDALERELSHGPLAMKELSQRLNLEADLLRQALNHSDRFIRTGWSREARWHLSKENVNA